MKRVDAVVIGAGFAGVYALYRLRQLDMTAQGYEAGDGVGGTWYWNRYPGARCDVESLDYSYSFSEDLEQEWNWTERYATQPEILSYINHVADRFDLRRDVAFETRVTSAVFDEGTGRWTIATDGGDVVSAGFVIAATGCLSAWRIPDFKGLELFEGPSYHTGNWPHAPVDFTGLRVGVIGTGSTGIQSIPRIAEQARHVFVFQRTPNFSVPAHNGPLDTETIRHRKENYREYRYLARHVQGGGIFPPAAKSALEDQPEQRAQEYEKRWESGGAQAMLSVYKDLTSNQEANDTAAEFVRRKIREVVIDPEVAQLLSPTDHPLGTKRLCVDTAYYETYNRDNVTLVDVRNAPIEEITRSGLLTGGTEYELDAIVFATGYDAMTGPLLSIDIRGRDGVALSERWADGPRTYLGIQVAGFPNLFTITGPGSPSVLSNMMVSIEQHVEWVTDCLAYLRDHGYETIEATPEAQEAWVEHVNEVGARTLYPLAKSWYVGANIPGKPQVFMPYVGGVPNYGKKCDEVAASGYEGFRLGVTSSLPG